ncbi:GRIP and coiled-coil domain-containing protein [Polyergus mexicanus]|uniref:GRIP and coiled-coil domain-containing protein n=1 Tax=Polyergus mexicanus TaxID=615972 RepID=UPI0038B4375C
MEFVATQIYEDDNFSPTQKIPDTIEEEELVQVGTLSIDSNEYQIMRGTTKIGRLCSCDIVINDATVSKIHAVIEAMRNQGSRTWICDLNSSNKTKLDNEILLPTRLYELKDGSIIKFGRVHAIYRAYRPMVIPETPAPLQKKVTSIIIPSTPDSSLNNLSSDDGSVILGTQKDEQNNVFRHPLNPQQHQSTSICKKNTSHASSSKNNDLQSATVLHASNINISENRKSSNIFDIETQKFEGHETVASNSIHDIETQIFPTDGSTHLIQVNTKINKQQESKLNLQDEVASTSATDIHDMETQHYESYINELETRKSEDNIRNVTPKKLTTDIHNAETQNYIDGTNNDDHNTKKSEIDKNKNKKKTLDQVECNINDLETLRFDNNDIAEDVSNVETQMDNIVNDINNDRVNTDKDTIAKTIKNGINDDNEKDKDNKVEIIKTKINYDNVAQLPNSRSSSPGSLNLSSPGVDEDCLSSLHSDHLLESSDLLEFFGEGIDKREEIRASNTSTPKSHTKTSERDNAGNISDNDEDNIFDALTQRIHDFEGKSDEINEKDICKLPKKKNGSKESINDDPKMDIEECSKQFAKQQRKSLEISDKSCNDNIDNKNDPGTSIESEDIFDAVTQRSNSPTVKDTSNSSGTNQLSKINETGTVDDMAPTQIINNNENTHVQGNLANKPLADNNDINNAIEDGQKKHVGRKKIEESFQADTDDSLEQKLNEMFENVNSSIHEPPHMSTQALEDILESSQSDNDLPVNKYTVNESSRTDSILQTQLKKKNRTSCDQSSCDTADTEANNVNNVEIDLQNSDTYFSTLTTRRKRNILKETQEKENELVDSTLQNVTSSHQDSNISQISKVNNEKVDDNTVTEFNKRDKKTSKTRNETDTVTDKTDSLNDNNVTETTSNNNGINENNLRLSIKRKCGAASEAGNKRILRNDPNKVEVDNVEKDSGSESNVCAPYSSKDVERAQTSDILYESDDDILTRLPAVKISGTLSNPASPSVSSTSTACSERFKRGIVKGRNKKIVRNKSLRKQSVENAKKNDKPTVSLLDNDMPSLDVLKTNNMTKHVVDTSDDSDSEMKNKRFKQMAERIMLNNKVDYSKRGKKNVRNTSDKKESVSNLSNLSNNLKLDTDEELKISSQISSGSRITRHSNKQNGESSDISCKEACMENVIYDKSTKPETRSIVTRRKRTLNTSEKDVEETNSRKREAQVVEKRPIFTRARRNTVKTDIDRQSPILNYFTKTNSRENSPVIGNTKSSRDNKIVSETTIEENKKALNLKTDENVRSNIKRGKRKINDDQAAMGVDVTMNKNNINTKQIQMQERQTAVNLLQDKVLKVVISPIRSSIINSIEDESQEVEMIMEKSLSNVQDKNLSIRETNTAKIFQRKLRLRSRKQSNIDTETDSALTESNTSSIIDDSSNTQSDDSTPKVKMRKRFTKSSARTQALEKKETFKKPTSVKNSASSVFDSSTEDTTSESSQNSNIENDTLSSSRSSRSKTASLRKKGKIEVTRNMRSMIDDSTSSKINTSTEFISLPSMPSTRVRRSTSVLNYSIPSTARHKVLFTGITEDYNDIVKTLGGNKVEDPAKCSILLTDKVRRTYKFLCALARGIPIVTINWLKDSESATRFLDWEGYILKDPAAEAKFGFRLRKSLDKAKEQKLLDGYTVVLTSNIAPPPIEELKDMITSCGGKALLRPPNKWPEKAVILSREEDLPNAKKFLVKAPKTVTIQSTEFILTGILRQETDFDKYKIM